MRLLRRFLTLAAIGATLSIAVAAPPTKLLVTGATLLTVKHGEEEPFVGYLAVGYDGRITAIGRGAPPADLSAEKTITADGKIIIPGFISAHSHVWQSAFRGLAPNELLRNWLTALRGQSESATSEDYYWFTLHGYLDHLRHGITTVYNFAAGGADRSFQEQQFKAGIDSGVRFVHGWSRSRQVSEADQRAALQSFLTYIQRYQSSVLPLKLALSGSAASRETVALDAAFVKEFDLINQTHFLEYPREKEEQRTRFADFVSAGALGRSLYFGHFIHTDDAMLAAVGQAGSGMSWNPLSNGRLASGIVDIPKYLSHGVKIGMGVDGQASADLPDPFENMRAGLYAVRGKYEDGTVLKPIDVLRFHTLGSATVMNIEKEVGSLEVGKFGDFLLIDPASVDRAPVYDPYATLVFACNVLNLDGVFVGGDFQGRFGKLTHPDFPLAQFELHLRVRALRNKTAAATLP